MTLLLDPRFPILWRTPTSVQIGADSPLAVLTEVSTAQEKMLSALGIGVTSQGLTLIGTEAGLSKSQVAEFQRAVRPALQQQGPATGVRVEVDGVGPTADRLMLRLNEAGVLATRAGTYELDHPNPVVADQPGPDLAQTLAGAPDLAVVVGDFILTPERRGYWLRRDIPHLPIIFGDTSVTIGPFIESGSGPCLFCLELGRRDTDPLWPVLAAQLLGRQSAAHQPFAATEAATLATRLVLNRIQDGAATSATAVILDTETGQRSEHGRYVHPECSCTGLTTVSEIDNTPSAEQTYRALSA